MRSLLFVTLFIFPFGASAQTYKDSLFAPGADPTKTGPLTTGENLAIHLHRVVGPGALFFDTFRAGINELKNDPGAWTRDGDGYAKRFGSAAGSNGVREMVGFGLDSALHTDPRIYRSTHTHFAGACTAPFPRWSSQGRTRAAALRLWPTSRARSRPGRSKRSGCLRTTLT